MPIRLVTFDALHTILRPRLPVYVQYSQTFEPFLGALDPEALKTSFKAALKQLQQERPAYQDGAQKWWEEVIHRTAVGAGADPVVILKYSYRDLCIDLVQERDTDYTATRDHVELKSMNIRTGIISNTDARMRDVLKDLRVLSYLDPVLLSEEVGMEKPSCEIYYRACRLANVPHSETVHIGDEFHADYHGAKNGGLRSLLIRRPGSEGEEEAKDDREDLAGVAVVSNLQEVVNWVKETNNGIRS